MTFLTEPLRSWRQRRRDRQRAALDALHAMLGNLHGLPVPPSPRIVDVECDAGWHWPDPNAHRAPVSAFETLLLAQHAARDALLH